MAFIRTQCDNSIRGIVDEYDCKGETISDEEAMVKVRQSFNDFVQTKVLSQVE